MLKSKDFCKECPLAPCLSFGVIGYNPEFKRKHIEEIKEFTRNFVGPRPYYPPRDKNKIPNVC